MVAGFNGDPKARASAECVGPSDCERDDCSVYDTSFFPQEACAELEVSMAFPTCWDGTSLDSPDHMSHVSYDLEGESMSEWIVGWIRNDKDSVLAGL